MLSGAIWQHAGIRRCAVRKADRLFQIIQILRRARKPITAESIAEELETSKRSVYRDIATLMGQRVPIRADQIDMVEVRRAIHGSRKIQLGYRDEKGEATARKVWPIAIGYLETVRMVVAWCEMRNDFRHFRTDRITAAEFLEERYPERPAALRARWRATLRDKVPSKKE
jgi:predicted DNA-binding transcriptional regulator YafY